MPLFGNKPKAKRTTYRRKSIEDQEKETEFKQKQKARDRAAELVKDNPDAEIAYINKLIGTNIQLPDPDREQKQEIQSIITNEALKVIQDNPELRTEFAKRRIEEVMGATSGRSDSEYGYGGNSITDLIEQFHQLKEFESELGGNQKGIFSAFQDPKSWEAISNILQILFGGAGRQQLTEAMYVVEIDGKQVKIPESQYNQLVEQGRIKPVGMLAEGEPAVKEEPLTGDELTAEDEAGIQTTTTSKEEPQLPEFLQEFNFDTILEMMEQLPEDFVPRLKAEVDEDNEESKLLWNFLGNTTYEGIVEWITPYKEHSQVGTYVEAVLSNKEWIEEVITLIKGYGRDSGS